MLFPIAGKMVILFQQLRSLLAHTTPLLKLSIHVRVRRESCYGNLIC